MSDPITLDEARLIAAVSNRVYGWGLGAEDVASTAESYLACRGRGFTGEAEIIRAARALGRADRQAEIDSLREAIRMLTEAAKAYLAAESDTDAGADADAELMLIAASARADATLDRGAP